MIFRTPDPTYEELVVINLIEKLRDTLGYVVQTAPRWAGLLRRSLFARNIQGSNTIEGYSVTLDDALAAAEGEEMFEAEDEAKQAVLNYRLAMTYVLQMAKFPEFKYSVETLQALHFMMIQHDLSKGPGAWRSGPINVVDERKREVVYEGPDADAVPELMAELVESLNSGTSNVHPLMLAAMAHLNLVMIHPFRDGNGRMGRCLQTLILGRALKTIDPNFASIEEYLGRNTPEYYQILGRTGLGHWNPQNDARPWIRFNLEAHYIQAMTIKRRYRILHRMWDLLELEVRKLKLPERVTLALVDASLKWRVRNTSYRNAADISGQVASRDLTNLTRLGLLEMKGRGRGAYYVASSKISALYEQCANAEPKHTGSPFALPEVSGAMLQLEGNVLGS